MKVRYRFLLAAGLLAVTAFFFHTAVLRTVGNAVVCSEKDFETADAGVVLAGGVPFRALQGLKLYKKGRIRKVFLTKEKLDAGDRQLLKHGIKPQKNYHINRQIFTKAGVESTKVHLLEKVSTSTWEDALALKAYLKSDPVDSVAVITSNFHSYRAYLNFQEALSGTGTVVLCAPSTNPDKYDPDNWWKDRDQMIYLYMELTKLGAYVAGFR